MNSINKKRAWAVIVFLLICITWGMGALRSESSLLPYIQQAMPESDHIVKITDNLYNAWANNDEKNLLGYVVTGTAKGYGGPLTLAVALEPSGKIIRAVLADHKETPAWISRVLKSDLISSLSGKSFIEHSDPGIDFDGVTGATASSKAIVEAAVNGSHTAAVYLGLPVEPQKPAGIVFGLPEAVLLLLLMAGYLGHQKNYRFKRQTRWISMLTGMVILGFIYNRPLTLVHISQFSMGYWPEWRTGLYWYILVGGILLILITSNRNHYCHWFCPFGAAQECMGLIGGIKLSKPRGHGILKMPQIILAVGAFLIGIYFRNPGLANYELYGTLFDLIGTSIQFAALGIILIAALFIRRPWCSYLCPVKPAVEFIQIFRRWGKEIWLKMNTKRL